MRNNDEIVINEKDVELLINDNEINYYYVLMSVDVYVEFYLGCFYN